MRRLAWLAAYWLACAAHAQQPAGQRHVIVVSLDGFSASSLQDPKIPLPALRRLMHEGGYADGMRPVNPTVTWPNHTAMVTGVNAATHGVIYNGLPVRPGDGKPIRIEPWVDPAVLVQTPTVYQAAHQAGLTTAEVDWVAIYRSPAIDWSFAEEPHADGSLEKELIHDGIFTAEEIASFTHQPITWRDDAWTRAAAYLIEHHRPNLLLMHLLTTDSVQHQYGAGSLAAQAALVLADRQLDRVLDAVKRAGIENNTTVLVVSDHGFRAYHHAIRPNALLRDKGMLKGEGAQIECDAYVVAEGGTAMVYATRAARRDSTIEELKQAFHNVKGVERVITPDEYGQYGYPPPGPEQRMADLVLAAAPDYAFTGDAKGDVVADVPVAGNHGYLNTDPEMQEILVTWGAGIRPGSHTGVVPNLDVASTIAHLLGVRLPASAGKPVSELLQ